MVEMKICFNEGCSYLCDDHSVKKDLEYCEKYGFDYIDIQEKCLNADLESQACTLEELGKWFSEHNLKMYSYNALEAFNMRQTEREQEWVLAHLKEIVRRCRILGCDLIVLCPSENLKTDASIPRIHRDTVEMLKRMLSVTEPFQIRLALEFCGFPSMSVNRFQEAYAIVQEIDSPLLGLTLDQAHFHSMASDWISLEKADGKKIFTWHLNDLEDLPCGAAYNDVAKRLFPGDKRGCMDHKRYAETLKNIGYEGACSIEVFRPEYYRLGQEEVICAAAKCIKEHLRKYTV